MSKKLEEDLVASRYAQSLYEVAKNKKATAKVASDLTSLEGLCKSDKNFKKFISLKTASNADLVAAAESISKKAKFNALTTNLLQTLASNNRLAFLPSVIASYKDVAANDNAEIKVIATLAKKPSPAQVEKIKKSVKAIVGKQTPVIETVIDESILGGIKIRVGSHLLDYSLKNKLEGIKKHLNSNIS